MLFGAGIALLFKKTAAPDALLCGKAGTRGGSDLEPDQAALFSGRCFFSSWRLGSRFFSGGRRFRSRSSGSRRGLFSF